MVILNICLKLPGQVMALWLFAASVVELSGQVTPPSPPTDSAAPVAPVTPTRDLNFYRISGNLTTGVMISKQSVVSTVTSTGTSEDFSKANLYIGLHLNRSWIIRKSWQLENLFDVRLTAIPVQTNVVEGPAGNAGGSIPNSNVGGTAASDTASRISSDPNKFLLTSRKAAQMQFGLFVPFIQPSESEAVPETDTTGKHLAYANGDKKYFRRAFYIAPIAKVGIQTLTEGQSSAEMARFGQDDVYNFWAVGGRIGVLRRFYREKRHCPDKIPNQKFQGASETTCAPNLDKDRGSENLLHFDAMYGKFENFALPSTFQREFSDEEALRAGNRLWRQAFEGRLRLPYLPYTFVGFDANLGKGRDDVRFIFGINIELGPLVSLVNP